MKWRYDALSDDNYQMLSQYIRAITLRYLRHPAHEMYEDAIAEGWYIALKTIQQFETRKSTKWTTYLWPYLNFGIIKYLNKQKRLMNEAKTVRKTDWFRNECNCALYRIQASIFEPNPYRLMPDEVYENNECIELWQKMRQYYGKDIQTCLVITPRHANNCIRKRLSRERKQSMCNLHRGFASIRRSVGQIPLYERCENDEFTTDPV